MLVILMSEVVQWGHDLSVMDTRHGYRQGRAFGVLQWGHDLSVMDTTTAGC